MECLRVNIRAETDDDHAAIHQVNEQAFGRSAEARLVDSLRQSARPYISLVAVKDAQQIVGHIFFSPVSIKSDDGISVALGLAPMAVLPEFQGQGVGSQLVRRGLEECRTLGHDVVVVLGHPQYYPRFGFTPARYAGLSCEYDVPDEAFMVAELKNGALGEGSRGLVTYHPAFNQL